MPSPNLPSTPGDNTYASRTLDHHGLVAGMVDELGLVEKIDAMIPQDLGQRQVSVGVAVKAMIIIGLGFVQRALYLTPDFFRGKPVERLLGPGITAEMLNDDALNSGDGSAAAGVVHIRQGYSRDHRPDLNQVVLQLVVESQAGIPLLMAAGCTTWSPTAPCTPRSPCANWTARCGSAGFPRPLARLARSSRRWRAT